jgi:hypothetical protein
VPWIAVLVALVGFAFIALPLIGLIQQVPWGNLWSDLTDPEATSALKLSVICSLWATALSVGFGVPLAYVLARVEFPGRSLVRALVLWYGYDAAVQEIYERVVPRLAEMDVVVPRSDGDLGALHADVPDDGRR